jgi:hypothetical protein
MNLLIAVLFLILGLVGTFRTDWIGKFKDERQKRLCRRCFIIVFILGIVLLTIEFTGLGKH